MYLIPVLIGLSVLLFVVIITLATLLLCSKRKRFVSRSLILQSQQLEETGIENPTYIPDVENDGRDYENVPNKRIKQTEKVAKYENIEVAKEIGEKENQKHVVKLKELNQHIRKLHKNSNRLLKKELKALHAASPSLPMTVAQKIENKKKNLSTIKLPYDENRVKLIREEEPNKDYVNITHNDYINASYVAGSSGDQKEYIVTIDPLRSTVEDFWTMIWQEEVHSIIMLSDLDKLFHKYWDGFNKTKKVDKLTIELKTTVGKKNYNCNIFELTKDGKVRSLRQYHLAGWRNGCPVISPLDVINFLEDVYRNVPETLAGGKIVVHSRTGNGRCGVIVGVDICRRTMRDMELSDEIDIFEIVLKMLKARIKIISLDTQYGFIYDAVSEMTKGRKKKLEENYSTLVAKSENSHLYSGIMF